MIRLIACVTPTSAPTVLPLSVDRTYLHSSALLSLVHPVGWELTQDEQKIDPKVAYNVACAFARDANLSEAMEWVRRALDAGFGDRDALLFDPDLEALRSVPEFGSVLARFDARNI